MYVKNSTSWLGADCIYFHSEKDGSASLSLDMDSAYFGGERLKNSYYTGINATRSFAVDYSKKSGVEAVILVQDEISGTGDKRWVMHTDLNQVLLDRNSFTIKQGQTYMKGYFLYPDNPNLKYFPENREISAQSPDHFQVVMMLVNGKSPIPGIKNNGFYKEVRIGKAEYFFEKEKIIIK